VKLVGAQPHETLGTWYNSADIFCLASENEGCPNVVVEAMACGLPVVTTDAGAELVVSPSFGIVTGRTSPEFETAIEKALLLNWDCVSIVAYAHSTTWDQVASRVLDVFSGVARDRRAPGI
jgi:glycosyltransferase involved in cell wall biosynthesis